MPESTVTRARDLLSPFASGPVLAYHTELHCEGTVRFLLVSGERDDTKWGVVGAFWLADEGGHGGFLLSPDSLWLGSEMVRSFRAALSRGWTEESIYRYWEGQAGSAGTCMIDPESRADSLFQVARKVGAL